jgi:hypothetical protein
MKMKNAAYLWSKLLLAMDCAKREGMSYAVEVKQASETSHGLDYCSAVIFVDGEKFRVTIEKEQ